ncbi:MAG: hypoxanthine-guanine phosphoribosyltransferase [Xanthomonadales bacterium]|nr:hypoxanthine-guanine phosphoribosyltransferase [Xanthomonadales bacterium]
MDMNRTHDPDDLLARSEVLVDRDGVRDMLDRLAREIAVTIGGEPLTLVAVMTGGMLPAAWLALRLMQPLQVDFVHATRYRGGTRGGELDFRVQPHLDVTDRHVLVVDDIYDEGHTLKLVCEAYAGRGARSVRSAVLVRKMHDRGLPRHVPDFIGLDVPDVYVFGCGMDAYEEWRHLEEIRALPDA